MRFLVRFLVPAALSAFLLTACPAGDDAPKEDEVEALKKRVTRLETRLRQIEGRLGKPNAGKPGAKPGQPGRGGKAPAKPPAEAPPTGPTRQVAVEGDAKAVMLTGAQRRFRVPGPVPAGDYRVMAAFGEDPLAPKGQISIAEGEAPLTLVCTAASDACKLKP